MKNNFHDLQGEIAMNKDPESKSIIGKIAEAFLGAFSSIYIVNTDRFKTDRFLYQKGSFAYVMDQSRSIDINTCYHVNKP